MSEPPPSPATTTPLERAVREIERHAAEGDWDAPPRIYALVATVDLMERYPDVGVRLLADDTQTAGELTPVEQEALPEDEPLEDVLAGIGWPPEVLGCALVVERLVLPPGAEDDAPSEKIAVESWAAVHPNREEVRMVVGVLRDGSSACALRLRSHDEDHEVITGPDLVPGLIAGLGDTLAD
jgi:hypothetical protein